MIAGHLDEVGFMVTQIDDKGFIKFQTVGGWVSQVMLAQKVTIVTRSGEEITGVIGSKPPHVMTAAERQKSFDIKDMFIDVGAVDKAEVESYGIRPGDMIVPAFDFTVMKNEKFLLAKAWDNRIGLAIAIEVLKTYKKNNIQISFTALERFKKKSVYVVPKQQHTSFNQILVLPLTLVSQEIHQALQTKKQ